MLFPSQSALILAPMEGVTDAPMRAVQGELGTFTHAVSEFLRISQHVPPASVFYRHVPELRHDSLTPTGLPVQVQLLGGHPGRMAQSALVAVACGAKAVDLNFGCPARTVNRHDGGATLLRYPKRIREIVRAVRDAVPQEIPVSAKMRLGWDCIDAIDENAAMAEEGGVSWLTIHGRTREAGYAPPIYWSPIGRVRRRLGIPVVANGDVWTIEDFRRCRDETGCRHFMLGRGALADPDLPFRVAEELGLIYPHRSTTPTIEWGSRLQRLVEWSNRLRGDRPSFVLARLKQWLRMAEKSGRFTDFESIKRSGSVEDLMSALSAKSTQNAI